MRQAAFNNKGIPRPRSFRPEMTRVVQKCSIVNQPNVCINWGIEEHTHFSVKGKVNEFETHNLTIKTSKPIFKVQVATSQQKRAEVKAGSMILWPPQQNLREALFLFKGFFLSGQLKSATSSMKSFPSLTLSLAKIWVTLCFRPHSALTEWDHGGVRPWCSPSRHP